jgi:hypothetical protein
VQKAIDDETRERKAGDTQLNQKIDDMDFDLNEKLNKEISDRNSQIKQLEQEIKEESDKQRKFVNDLRDKVITEFNHVTVNMQKEIQHRLSQQDDKLDILSNVVKTIQDTLAVLGKT